VMPVRSRIESVGVAIPLSVVMVRAGVGSLRLFSLSIVRTTAIGVLVGVLMAISVMT